MLAGILPAWAGPKEDGDAAFKAGKMAEADAAYTQVLAAKPDDAPSLIRRAQARDNLGRKADAAADFDQAVQVAPNNPDAWHYRGIFRYFRQDYKGALDDLNKGAELAPQSAPAFESRGAVEVALKDYNAAIVDCTRAIQIRPNFIMALNWRGFAWQQLKDPASALRDFEAVIKLDPRNTYALTHRAMIYEARGEGEKAAQEYRLVLVLDPKQKDAASHLAALQKVATAAPGPSSEVNTPQPKTVAVTAKGAEAPAKPASIVQGTTPARTAIVTAPKLQTAAPAPAVSAAAPRTDNAASPLAAPQANLPPSPATPDATSTSVAYHGSSAAPESGVPTSADAKAPAPAGPKGPAAPTAQPADQAANKPQTPASDSTKDIQSQRNDLDFIPDEKGPVPKSGFYKLVKVETPPEGALGNYWRSAMNSNHPSDTESRKVDAHFEGSATDARFVFDLTFDQNNYMRPQSVAPLPPLWRSIKDELHWTAPANVIPGVPAHFHLDAPVAAAPELLLAYGGIMYFGPAPEANDSWFPGTVAHNPWYILGLASEPGDNPPERIVNVDITLPDLVPLFKKYALSGGKENPSTSMPRPHFTGNFSDYNSSPPSGPVVLPLENWGSNLALIVTVEPPPPWAFAEYVVARYTYQWVGPPPAPGAGANPLEVVLQPGPKKDLRADGHDGIYVQARVKPKDESDAATAQTATAGITFTAEGVNSKWMDLHYKPEVRDGWQVTMVQASNPNAAREGAGKPPTTLTVMAHAQKAGVTLTQTLDIPVVTPEISTKPDVVEFTSQSGDSLKVAVAIDNPGPDHWDFRAEYDKDSRKVALANIKSADGKTAALTLKEAGLDPLHDGSNREQAILKIIAEQKGSAALEYDLKINVVQEGLFVSTTGRDPETNLFVVNGDGKGAPTEIDVRVYGKDSKTKKVVNLTAKAETLKALSATCLELKGSPGSNVLEVGKLDSRFDRVRQVNDPAAVLRLVLPKEVPADGRVVPCDFKISYNGSSESAFSSIVTIGVATTGNGPGSPNWQEELDRCQEVITKFVPAAYYPKMQAMLDQRKMTLGPDGLRELRRKIWSAAAELTLGEGGQGYASEAAWAGAITDVLEWSQWAGDMAFNAAIGSFTGPFGAAGAGMLKGAVISAVNAYQEGETADAWLWENLGTIPGMVEGQLIDPSKFKEWGMESQAKAWALYVSYHFLKNLYEGQSLVEALKNTAKEAGGNVLGSWLGEEVKMHGNTSVTEWTGQKGQQIAATMAKFKALAAPAGSAPNTTGSERTSPTPETAAPARRQSGETTATKGASEQAATEAVPAEQAPATQDQAAPQTQEAAAAKGATEQAPAPEAVPAATPAEQAPGTNEQAAPAAEPTPAQEAQVVALVRDNTTHGLAGEPLANLQVVLAIMTDPTMVRALKNAPAEVQQAFANTRETIYRWHDGEVVQHVKDTVPGLSDREVKVLEFRTPGATGPSLNTDRDYRVCYLAGHDVNGNEQWIEVPRKHWEDTSYNTFARLTGGPTGSPAASKKWAADHQQLATDKFHPEASAAFSDQKYVFNKGVGQYGYVQVVSNVEQVAAVLQRRKWDMDTRKWETVPEDSSLTPAVGVDDVVPPASSGANPLRVSLEDPQSLGQMYQIKVHDASQPQEAFVQANKAVQQLICLRKSYNVQGRDIGTISGPMQAAMEAVTAVTEKLAADPNRRDPKAVTDAQKALRANGFSGLGDFMNKLGGQFEAFKNM